MLVLFVQKKQMKYLMVKTVYVLMDTEETVMENAVKL